MPRTAKQYRAAPVLSLIVFYICLQSLCILTVWRNGLILQTMPNEINRGTHRALKGVMFTHAHINYSAGEPKSPSTPGWQKLLKVMSKIYRYEKKSALKERFKEGVDKNVGIENLTLTAERLAMQFITVRGLIARAQQYCNNTVSTLAYHSVLMQDVTVNAGHVQEPAGRESVPKLKTQTESGEFLKLRRGLLELSTNCSESDIYRMNTRKGRLVENWNSYVVRRKTTGTNWLKSFNTGVVVVRYEYANLYWCIVDLYNAFLVLRLWELSPNDAVVILADSHPRSTLEDLWAIYGVQLRLGQLNTTRIHFRSLVWLSHRHYDSILTRGPPFPLFPEFREFVYDRYGLIESPSNRCNKIPLVIVFIWRRDYIAHPRNPGGVIKRKIINEQELFNYAVESFPGHIIRGVQLDKYNISEQLRIISQTDILIGVHGAGLAYGAFLPPGSGMLELFPMFYLRNPNNHMEILARGNGVLYRPWYNRSPVLEDKTTDSLILPVKHVISLIHNMKGAFCNSDNDIK